MRLTLTDLMPMSVTKPMSHRIKATTILNGKAMVCTITRSLEIGAHFRYVGSAFAHYKHIHQTT